MAEYGSSEQWLSKAAAAWEKTESPETVVELVTGKLASASDGAEWIRSLAAWLPFETLLTLDLYHVKHRMSGVTSLLCGQHSPAAQPYVPRRIS